MMNASKSLLNMLAVDIGAGSGRVINGKYNGLRLQLEEVHRFSNKYVNLRGSFYWDLLLLWCEIKNGLGLGIRNNGGVVDGISVDTWGADFCLFDKSGCLLGNPYNYRDERTLGILCDIFDLIPAKKLFDLTGNQPVDFSTLGQLFSMKRSNSPLLEAACDLLPMANTFIYFLSDRKEIDFTNATGTMLYDCKSNEWSKDILNICGLDRKILSNVVSCGTIAGEISHSVSTEIGGGSSKIINSGGHDTSLAAISVPAEYEDYLYINSGTWSVMGIVTNTAITDIKAFKAGLTNFGIPGGKYTLCSIFSGMWLLQECRRYWKTIGKDFSYDEIMFMAEKELPHQCFIDVENKVLMKPGNMHAIISEYCAKSDQNIPDTVGQIAICIIESIAFKYREALERIESVVAKKYESIHIVGGGSLDRLLCQFTANACGRKVLAGPTEATVLGNVSMQLIAIGETKSIRETRDIIKNSFPTKVYIPESKDDFEDAYYRYKKITKGS